MAKEKMEWALYTNPQSSVKESIYYEDVDRVEYESKYRNNITCINGCDAKVKFTHRKNNVKFFSTWNGEGNKHNEGCPFHVIYKGKLGRLRLKSYYEKRELNDNDIKITLLNKIRGLKRKYNGEDENKIQTSTKNIEDTGELLVPEDDTEAISTDNLHNKDRRMHNIMSIDARHLSMTYVGTRKCVYGIASNVQIENRNGGYFAYINLDNNGYSVSTYFPMAFYSQETGVTLDDFKRLFKILNIEINDKPKRKIVIVCYGEIKRKAKKGININIINEKHIYINDMSIRQILSEGKLKNIDYDIV